MMKRVNLMFGIHSHQPVGNFESVFRQSYETCYRPFLETLARHPGVRASLHYSGSLLEWIENNEPDCIDMIAMLAERGQVEMLSGGFYEPIIPIIPRDDAVGQIRMMNDYIRRRFGQEPTGLWLTERVWEPHLPSIIAEAGLRYTIVDETHFAHAGLGPDDMFGYYLTEDTGHTVAVFPIDKQLRYSIPFKLPEDTLEYLRSIPARDNQVDVTYGDDGEKFGVWPETYKWVYTEGYLERFFTMLEENSDWLHMPTFSEVLQARPPMGRIYLPASSYDEMMEWALPVEAAIRYEDIIAKLKADGLYEKYRPFTRGGFWRSFLAKYPESNRMHKKMLLVSRRVNSLKGKAREEARRELWRAQSNCPFWHGLFGGLYLNYLRFANYSNLIRAESIAAGATDKNRSKIILEQTDYDCDGHEELLVSTPLYNFYMSPAHGGSVVEIDYKPKCFNITDVMSRRPESYHRKLTAAHSAGGENEVKSIHDILRVKEEGLEEHLCYDSYERRCFLDHFLPAATTVDDFASARHSESGDFLGTPYEITGRKESRDTLTLALRRDGSLHLHDRAIPLSVEKKFVISDKTGIEARYSLRTGEESINLAIFAVELNLTLLAGDSEDRFYEVPGVQIEANRMNSAGALESVKFVRLVDRWMNIAIVIRCEPAATLWRFPVETVSQSEGGFEKTYQGSCVTAVWPLSLKDAEYSIKIQVEPL
jgi:alpha-amylase/alpha-mannosidase (GH57 family)